MMMSGFFVVSILAFVICTMAVMLFLGLWTYKDAQVKSEHSPVLWVLVVLLVPNMMGIIVYLLVGRSKKDVPAPKTFLRPLIASVVLFIVATAVFIVSMVLLALGGTGGLPHNMAWNSGVWAVSRSHYSNGEWTVSARRGNGTKRRTHELTAEQLESFRFSGNADEGGLYLMLDQGETYYSIDISDNVMGHKFAPRGFCAGAHTKNNSLRTGAGRASYFKLANALITKSSCSFVWAAETWQRTRAFPRGTTGKKNPIA
jgi:hypothetical protein